MSTDFSSYFSSHKNLATSALVALAILAVGIAVNWKNPLKPELSPQNLPPGNLTISTSTNMTDRDSDADGLPDWEEHLYGSDPLKFDSDGDGAPDGKEVREGRDPSRKNTGTSTPNDLLSTLTDPHFATSATDILGIKKEFFAKFLTQQAQEIRQNTYLNLLKNFDAKKVTPTNQMVDLNISSDNSPEALRAYGNAFGVIIQKYTKRTHPTEQEIMTDALKSSSTPILKQLQLPAIDYKNFSKDLKTLKTPSIMAQPHLKIVNGYEQMSLGLLAMQQLFLDPVVGAGGYEAYTKGKVDVTDGYATVVITFGKEKIVFTREEAGAPFYFQPSTASSSMNYQNL